MTFNEFYQQISASAFPEGEAENLITQHKNAVKDALIELQTKVPCLRGNHLEYVGQSSTMYHCGSNAFDSVDGNIERVYTQVMDSGCDEIDYRYISYEQMRNLIHSYRCCRVFSAPGMTPYTADNEPGPVQYIVAGADTDKTYRTRSGNGYWALHKGTIYVFPSIESTEQIVVEWSGIQRNFDDSTVLPTSFTDRDVMSAVERYLDMEVARRETKSTNDYKLALTSWTDAVGLLIYNCNQKRRTYQRIAGPTPNAC